MSTLLQQMESYYDALPRWGYSSRCDLVLPDGLSGKRVLDLLCRRGKGVYKISDYTGPKGFVLGVDFDENFIQTALQKTSAYCPTSLKKPLLAFKQAYPEGLQSAGIEAASFDVLIVNSAFNLVWDVAQSLREIKRILSPEGVFYYRGLFSKTPLPRAEQVNYASRGNVFGAALSIQSFAALLGQTGFSRLKCEEATSLVPEGRDYERTLGALEFFAVTLSAQK